MADLDLTVSSGLVALVSATAKSILQIKAAAQQRLVLKGYIIAGGSAIGGTDAAVKCRFTRSIANFGTFTSATPGKLDPSKTETIQSSAGYNASVEPTSPTDTDEYFTFNPEGAPIIVLLPEPLWKKVPGGASIQLEMTSVSGTPNVEATFIYQE